MFLDETLGLPVFYAFISEMQAETLKDSVRCLLDGGHRHIIAA